MKKYRILMTPENARKCHDGTKTVTRRVIVPQPPEGAEYAGMDRGIASWTYPDRDGETNYWHAKPKYRPGDIVAIAETHWRWGRWASQSRAGRPSRRFDPSCYKQYGDEVLFRDPQRAGCDASGNRYHKRPGLFMPFDLARTYWEIGGVGAERLHDITNTDILAEGIEPLEGDAPTDDPWDDFEVHYVQAFRELWDSISAKRGYPWAGNWWVWRHEGKRVELKGAECGYTHQHERSLKPIE